MADVEAAAAGTVKSDLPVRAASAAVMLVIAGTALWIGGRVLDILVAIVAMVTLIEMLKLIEKAAPNPVWQIVGTVGGVAYIGLAMACLIAMPALIVAIVVCLVIATDTAAYFAGRTFGKKKIAPSISPSKTWAGLYGGMSAAGLVGAIAMGFIVLAASAMAPNKPGIPWAAMLAGAALGALLAVVAQAGDFFESWLKRRAGVKDSSRLIPGHGGVFDRVDGLLPVAIIAGLISAYFTAGI